MGFIWFLEIIVMKSTCIAKNLTNMMHVVVVKNVKHDKAKYVFYAERNQSVLKIA